MNLQMLLAKAAQKAPYRVRRFCEKPWRDLQFRVSDEAILVYQMAKVGSTTLYFTLKETLFWTPVVHVHVLSEQKLASMVDLYGPNKNFIALGHDLNSKIDRAVVKRWKIVTLVRDPIARELSLFFQTMDRRYPHELSNGVLKDPNRAVEILQSKICAFDASTDTCCTWFDRELKSRFDIDVFDFEFDQQAGYQVIQRQNVDVLIIRLEDLDRCGSIALKEFLPVCQAMPLIRKNSGSHKAYATQYREVKSKLLLPKEVCERIYSSRFATHFYGDDQRRALIERWSQ